MATVLIVDDNPIDRRLAAGIVEKVGMQTSFAVHGREALEVIEADPPEIVLTDLLMPEMDGLELVERIKADHPTIPVILMTAHGSEEIAVKALRTGAASYVPKANLPRDLVHTVRDVLSVATAKKDEQKALSCLWEADLRFVMGVRNGTHEPLVGFLQEQLRTWRLCDDADLIRVGTALHEAFVNAIEHGNLELASDLRDDPDGSYQIIGDRRRQEPPYCDRNVHVSAQMTRELATITIRDEGPGFDPSTLPDPTDPENIGKISGRGLLLIRTFMDDVHFNETGNEITMVKRKPEE
ncbi:MAG: ATP-binding protein [Planctomycetes bacterium]|nr:ATP-binding protein [Planctomycetota bacterium]MBL7041858.1 ATP-binding protein [Pirellulaceae bacterium]